VPVYLVGVYRGVTRGVRGERRGGQHRSEDQRAGQGQDGETVEIEIERIGRMSLNVVDPLKRSWERGIYMGVDSTNPEAVKRHRPQSPG